MVNECKQSMKAAGRENLAIKERTERMPISSLNHIQEPKTRKQAQHNRLHKIAFIP